MHNTLACFTGREILHVHSDLARHQLMPHQRAVERKRSRAPVETATDETRDDNDDDSRCERRWFGTPPRPQQVLVGIAQRPSLVAASSSSSALLVSSPQRYTLTVVDAARGRRFNVEWATNEPLGHVILRILTGAGLVTLEDAAQCVRGASPGGGEVGPTGQPDTADVPVDAESIPEPPAEVRWDTASGGHLCRRPLLLPWTLVHRARSLRCSHLFSGGPNGEYLRPAHDYFALGCHNAVLFRDH